MTPLQPILRGGLLALVCFSAPAFAGLFTDADPDWKEGGHTLPAAPRDGALREFFVSSASPNHFFIDEDSIAVGEDGVVRYTLVIRTPGGAKNVTNEGIRCASGTWRLYATGRSGGDWSAARDADWKPIVDNTYNRPRAALSEDHFCDGPVPPRDRDEVLRRLRGEASTFMKSGK
ncbi:CNP1-like family protein [Azoarcus sp. DN11]|uniref:CNP1-like family protein n=1 Tax=Azoarcus sp. DN11 TaxID=356837 RepID=UPI000EB522B4|nr:CNP1-like family protein [Azoarcus sp. DN11]AYH42852.1 hypothetical protein CDA09_05525 [Azoarcus sp. DN11]